MRIEVGIGHRAWSIGQDSSHMPAASLGQYASLAFVVIGRRWNWGLRNVNLTRPSICYGEAGVDGNYKSL
jgi:hypothetical protein